DGALPIFERVAPDGFGAARLVAADRADRTAVLREHVAADPAHVLWHLLTNRGRPRLVSRCQRTCAGSAATCSRSTAVRSARSAATRRAAPKPSGATRSKIGRAPS